MNSIPPRRPSRASLDLAKHSKLLRAWLDTVPGLVAELARDELADIIRLTGRSTHWPSASVNGSARSPRRC